MTVGPDGGKSLPWRVVHWGIGDGVTLVEGARIAADAVTGAVFGDAGTDVRVGLPRSYTPVQYEGCPAASVVHVVDLRPSRQQRRRGDEPPRPGTAAFGASARAGTTVDGVEGTWFVGERRASARRTRTHCREIDRT